jgi:protein phosphatase
MPDLTEEQRSELPKNVITRALGMQDQVVVDIQHDDPRPGDVYCLCSDGLSGMVQDDEILKIVSSAADIGEACRNLIARANEHGGEDNITAVLIKIEEQVDAPTEEIPAARRSGPGASAAGDDDDLGMSDEPTAPGLVGPPPGRSKPPTAS